MPATEREREAIREFDERIRKTFDVVARKGKLDEIGGDFSVVVFEEACWTVITSGPRAGVHAEATDDEMGFMFITTPQIFAAMNDPEDDGEGLDLDAVVEDGKVAMHGDVEIYVRFIAHGQADDMLSIRGRRSNGKATDRARMRAKRARKRSV